MKLETVEEFLRFKRLHNYVNQPLQKCNKDEILMDVLGKPIRVEGLWKAPKNADIYKAAIATLHHAHGQKQSYTRLCKECYKLPINKRHLHHHFQCLFVMSKGKIKWRRDIGPSSPFRTGRASKRDHS